MTKSISLEAKKAYIRKSRAANYAASLKLKGSKVGDKTPVISDTKAQVIAKYTLLVRI